MALARSTERVAVTGGGGFLGSFVVERLRATGAEPFVPRSRDYDLRRAADVERFFAEARPEIVIHLAAVVGGIQANRASPAAFFHDNLMMGLLVIEGARRHGVRRFVCAGTTCSYPEHTPVPFRESSLWDGYPEPTNAPYGIAKKSLLVQMQAYREQYGFAGAYLLPANLYGPRDAFDPARSHVVPALIAKCLDARDAGAPSVRCWGTGHATRDFLYVEDCAEAVVLAAASVDEPEPINVGTGREISIRDLALAIGRATGFAGVFEWDPSMPDGQPRRVMDVSRAAERLGFRASTGLDDGLLRTVRWYESARRAPRS